MFILWPLHFRLYLTHNPYLNLNILSSILIFSILEIPPKHNIFIFPLPLILFLRIIIHGSTISSSFTCPLTGRNHPWLTISSSFLLLGTMIHRRALLLFSIAHCLHFLVLHFFKKKKWQDNIAWIGFFLKKTTQLLDQANSASSSVSANLSGS